MPYSEPTNSFKLGKIIIISVIGLLIVFIVVMLIVQSRFGKIGNDPVVDPPVEVLTP